MLKRISRGLEKWGHYLLALLCAGVILLSAVWTREGRPSEGENQEALADQSQRLAQALPEATAIPWRRPVGGAVVQGYSEAPVCFAGTGVWMAHPALDFFAEDGEKVAAMAAGTVTECGDAVRIDHGDGEASLYKGLKEISVRPGQRVRAGETIGTAGSTVAYEGAGHICVAVLEDGRPVPFGPEWVEETE